MSPVEEPEIQAFVLAVSNRDFEATRRLLESSALAREHVNSPIFAFGGRAAHQVAGDITMLDLLIAHGADVNLRSDWEKGPFTVLELADEKSARHLLVRGAELTPIAAARLGWLEELRSILDVAPERVNERGGDGQTPLHQAKNEAIAEYLLGRGADIELRCIDHQSTPAQYALAERPEVCRLLLERGAGPDIFIAARLGDVMLADRLIDADPSCLEARVGLPGYDRLPSDIPIYCWSLGFYASPCEVADQFGNGELRDHLLQRSPPRLRFIEAAWRADEKAARAEARVDPSLPSSLTERDHGLLARAVFRGLYQAAAIMIELGFDPAQPGHDGGTALHLACCTGNVPLVELLLAHGGVPLDQRDRHHGGTPLSWAVYGAVHWRTKGSDYPGVIDRLFAAGAGSHLDDNAREWLKEFAENRPDVREVLRGHGFLSA